MIAPCFVFHGWWSGPSPGFLLVLALRLCTRVKPLAGGPGASLSHCRALHKNGDPNSGLFSRPRLAVDEREHGHRWAFTCTWPPSFSYLIASTGGLAMIHILRPLSRPVFADGGRLSGHSHRPHRSTQSLPSRVSPFYTRWWALRLARCSKVPVISSFLGSRLDSPSRSLTVPLLAPFLLAAGVSRCLFSLALRYWLTLLLLSPLFHILITSKFSTLPHIRHFMPRLPVCFLTVLPVPIPANLTLTATPADRSLVMRALGGAITSPCSNDPESRRPTPTIFGLSPQLLFHC